MGLKPLITFFFNNCGFEFIVNVNTVVLKVWKCGQDEF